ncbi:MAG: hypothetical protein IT292_08310 [Deltaproteobacteria bacterium]|nr:hypothetical protein [Deltaproteobacteria bacterium]
MKFSRTVSLPGIIGAGDSGGIATIEQNGEILMAGVLVTGSGSSENKLSGFEFLDANGGIFDWMNNIIQSNGENPTPTLTSTATTTATLTETITETPTATVTASPPPTSTEHESAVVEWELYQ